MGKSKVATDLEPKGIGPETIAPKHLIDLYQLSKNKGKGQYESHLAIEPEAQKSGDSTGLKFKMRRHKGQHERWRRPNGRR